MKQKVIYECNACGATSPRWLGKCTNCGAWNSMEETLTESKQAKVNAVKSHDVKIYKLSEIQSLHNYRIDSGISEFNRALGGGIIPGSCVLIGGDPGIGKSTLALQMCSNLVNPKSLYITGEESYEQIKYRAQRIEGVPEDLQLLAETNAEIIDSAIRSSDCGVVVVDSIQSIYLDRIEAAPGSMVQVRECASLLMRAAKQTNKAIFIIGHVNKEGAIAGPKILEHLVDTVLQFEGEKNYSFRILRCQKNRFGSTNEIGVFEMGDTGLTEVTNPSEIFMAKRRADDSGVAIIATMEGTRPILLEAQALVAPTGYGTPQRNANGFDMRRLQMILAVLEKRLGIQFRHNDVFVNIAGGVYLNDSAADLGIAAALVSSHKDVPLNADTAFIGEIGLTGEIRSVSYIEQRIASAEKMGFKRVILAGATMNKISKRFNIEITPVDRISLAFSHIF